MQIVVHNFMRVCRCQRGNLNKFWCPLFIFKNIICSESYFPYLHVSPTRSEQGDRFYVWLEEEVTYLCIPYPLVCGKVLLKLYGKGTKQLRKRENIIAEIFSLFPERGNTIFNHRLLILNVYPIGMSLDNAPFPQQEEYL